MKKWMKRLDGLKRQLGRSGTEMAVYVTLSALVTIGGLAYLAYPESQKQNNEVTEVLNLKMKGAAWAAKHGGKFTGFTLDIACQQGFFPAARCSGSGGSTAVTNQWGASVTVSVATINVAGDGLKWTYAGVSNAGCVEEITQTWQQAAKIDVGATGVKTTTTQAIDDATANTQCNAASDNASVAWTFASR